MNPKVAMSVVSNVEVNKRVSDIIEVVGKAEHQLTDDIVTALGFLTLGIFLCRVKGLPPDTVKMLTATFMEQFSDLPSSEVEGRKLTPEEAERMVASQPFMARGNDTIN